MPETAVHSKALTALSVITPGKPARAKFNSAPRAPNAQEGNLLPSAQKEALAEQKALQDPAAQKRDGAHCHILLAHCHILRRGLRCCLLRDDPGQLVDGLSARQPGQNLVIRELARRSPRAHSSTTRGRGMHAATRRRRGGVDWVLVSVPC